MSLFNATSQAVFPDLFSTLQMLAHIPDPLYSDFLFTRAYSTSIIVHDVLIYYVSCLSICPHEVDRIQSSQEHFVI